MPAMSSSSNLALPYLAAGQAQKHVTVNETLRKLDALIQLAPVSATTTTQPSAPIDGEVYILPAGKTGAAWGAMAVGALAYFVDGAWAEITPREGWLAWARDTNLLLAYDGAAWGQSALRGALALGSAALENIATSGSGVPKLNAANTWGAAQTFSVPPVFTDKPGSLTALGSLHEAQSCAQADMAAGTTRYFGPAGESDTELKALFMATRAWTITRVRVLSVNPGGGQTRTVTVRKNTVATSMTGTMSGAASVTITANPVSLAQNDYFTIEVVNSAGAANATFCIVVVELTPA
jgi:hypothetical protein